MSDLNDEKSPFYDKRDEKFIKLISNTYFFEMYNKKKMKCDQTIPHSILFSKGQPIAWYFNSVKEKTPLILRKNQDKLHLYEIGKHFVGMGNLEDYKAENLISLNEYMQKTDSTQTVCILKYIDGKYDVMTAKELVKILANGINLTRIALIQSYIQNHSKAHETYYVEFRQEDITLQGNFKFFKKSPVIDLLNNSKRSYFKYLDESMNKKLQNCCQNIMMFIEKAYRVKVRKIVAKFLIDMTQKIYLLGCENLMIDITAHSPYQQEQLEHELREPPKGNGSNSFNEFVGLCKSYKKKNLGNTAASTASTFKLPKVVVDNDKQYSQKLYRQLRLEKCKGDFCDYQIAEQNKGFLVFRKHLLQEYSKHFTGKKKNEMEFVQMQLPHEISNQLILKARQKSDLVVDLFFKNRIFSKNSIYFDMTELEIMNHKMEKEVEYPFILKNHQADNYENLYKNVKICKNCFTFYQFLQENFDKGLQEQMKATSKAGSLNHTNMEGTQNNSFNNYARSEKSLNTKIIKRNSFSKTNTTIDQSHLDTSTSMKQRVESNGSLQKIKNTSQQNKFENTISRIQNKYTPLKQNENSEEISSIQPRDLRSAKEILNQLDNNQQKSLNSAMKPPLIRKSASSNIKVRFQRQSPQKTLTDEQNNKSINQSNQKSSSFFSNNPIENQDNKNDAYLKVNEYVKSQNQQKQTSGSRPSSNVSDKHQSFFEKVIEEMNSKNSKGSANSMTQKEMDLKKKYQDSNQKSSINFSSQKKLNKQENSLDPKKDSRYMNFLNYDKQNRMFRQQDNELQHLEKELKALNKNITLNVIDLTHQREQKLKSINPKDEGAFLSKQNEKRKTIIQKSKSESEARQQLQIYFLSNMQNNQTSLFSQISKYQPSQNLQHLRRLPAFQLSTPLKPFGEENNLQKIKDINLYKVIELMNYPQTLSDTTFLDQIKYCIIDKYTAIPYLLLYPQSQQVKSAYFNIICLDFFDSFLEYRQLFYQVQQKFPDQSFLFMNFPGQAHTIFKEESLFYDCDFNVKVIDQLLFELSENGYFDGSIQKVRCIGFGYGTYILQSFIIQSHRHLEIPSACFYNSISKFDKQLKDTLKQSLEVFECTPNDMPDLSFSYYSGLCNSKPLNEGQIKAKMKNNPIFNIGRCLILKGALESNEVFDKFQKITNIKVNLIHSLQNCLISITQSENLLKILQVQWSEEKNEVEGEIDYRKLQIIQGNHSILEDNREQLIDTLCSYLISEIEI
ncbi:hypothetical protein ABPG72_017997 [Tetrahymena utriculariae]